MLLFSFWCFIAALASAFEGTSSTKHVRTHTLYIPLNISRCNIDPLPFNLFASRIFINKFDTKLDSWWPYQMGLPLAWLMCCCNHMKLIHIRIQSSIPFTRTRRYILHQSTNICLFSRHVCVCAFRSDAHSSATELNK